MNKFTLYIVNGKNGNSRDITIKANDSYSARVICEVCCLKKEENVLCVYPSSKEPSIF